MNEPALIPKTADIGVVDASSLQDIDFDDGALHLRPVIHPLI